MSNVDAEGKRKLAEEIVDLTVMNKFRAFSDSTSQKSLDSLNRARIRMREEQIELYVKHFEIEQLNAILDFYGTDMGKSILSSHERMSDELASGVKLVSSNVHSSSSN